MVFVLYQKAGTFSATEFNRNNFYIKVILDDKPVDIPSANCDAQHRCSWDSVGSFLDSRLFSSEEIDNICFSHLNYAQLQGNMPWWLAFLISLPLVLATVAVIRCIVNRKDEKAPY